MSLVKQIPKVDRVLEWPAVKNALEGHSRPVVVAAVRKVLDDLRARALRGDLLPQDLSEAAIAPLISSSISQANAPHLKRVINGSGVVINTNLGRSPLPEQVKAHLLETAFAYSNLEYDLEKGERGTRYSHVESLLCELTGAESALVVNNNAAAVLLALSSMACGKEVVVSRGELVEIGGSFRVPDVMRQSGAILREVGTTNRTHPRDYRQAVTPETALFLKVHCSNFAIVGFTAEVEAAELVRIGAELSIPTMADVGSGNFIAEAGTPLAAEPPVSEYLRAGVDIVTFSGDKLLGGPQAGIIIGRKKFVDEMKKHQLLRALRIDKMTLAALEGTLRIYRDPMRALKEIPTLKMLCMDGAELAARAKSFVRRLRKDLPSNITVSVATGVSQVGGGALPLLELPTSLIAVEVSGFSAQDIDQRLRVGETPVVGRIYKNRYLLDVRTLLDSDLPDLVVALSSVA